LGRRFVQFKDCVHNYNKHLIFPDCTKLFVKNCNMDFIRHNVTDYHFPKLQTVAVYDRQYHVDHEYWSKYKWIVDDYSTVNKYRFYVSDHDIHDFPVDKLRYGILK